MFKPTCELLTRPSNPWRNGRRPRPVQGLLNMSAKKEEGMCILIDILYTDHTPMELDLIYK